MRIIAILTLALASTIVAAPINRNFAQTEAEDAAGRKHSAPSSDEVELDGPFGWLSSLWRGESAAAKAAKAAPAAGRTTEEGAESASQLATAEAQAKTAEAQRKTAELQAKKSGWGKYLMGGVTGIGLFGMATSFFKPPGAGGEGPPTASPAGAGAATDPYGSSYGSASASSPTAYAAAPPGAMFSSSFSSPYGSTAPGTGTAAPGGYGYGSYGYK